MRRVYRKHRIPGFGQFVAIGVLTLAVVAFGSLMMSRRIGLEESIDDVKNETELLAAQLSSIPRDITDIQTRASVATAFDMAVFDLEQNRGAVRVKLWTADGVIIYSDEPLLVGRSFELSATEQAAFSNRETIAEVDQLDEDEENEFEHDFDRLLEVYAPVDLESGEQLMVEAYYLYSAVEDASSQALLTFAPVILGSLVVMVLAHLGLAYNVTRRLRTVSDARANLSQRALDASAHERRRIAAHIHDDVMQDLVGAALTVEKAGQALALGTQREAARHLGAAARAAVAALRTLAVEIYPANLREVGLPSALEDLVSRFEMPTTEISSSYRVSVEIADDANQLLFRTVKEALANVRRHAKASTVNIDISDAAHARVRATISDDGVGFDPTSLDGSQLGLRLLADEAERLGALFEIESTPGSGTSISMEVPS